MPSGLSLLLVEDNEMVREEMVCFLARQGWHVQGVDCGEELNHWLGSHTPDIVILDVNLPYEDGYSIAARLRQTHPGIGIIMLTARVRPSDRVAGYQAGADVYLTKPTQTAELIAVIENLSTRLLPVGTAQLVLDRQSAELRGLQGEVCHLTPSEIKLLELLALSPGQAADSEYLLEALGDGSRQITRDNLSVLVSRLRGKCQRMTGVANLVLTHRGMGYRLSRPLRFE